MRVRPLPPPLPLPTRSLEAAESLTTISPAEPRRSKRSRREPETDEPTFSCSHKLQCLKNRQLNNNPNKHCTRHHLCIRNFCPVFYSGHRNSSNRIAKPAPKHQFRCLCNHTANSSGSSDIHLSNWYPRTLTTIGVDLHSDLKRLQETKICKAKKTHISSS